MQRSIHAAPVMGLLLLAIISHSAMAATAVPQRLVTLSPHATELVFAVGRGDRIVGTVEFSDFPAPARRIPRIGGYDSISIETLVALKPDLVITWSSGNPPALLDALAAQRIPVIDSSPTTLTAISADLRRLGDALDAHPEAETAAGTMEQRLGALRQQYGAQPRVSVFYEAWDSPLYTLGGAHFFNDLLAVCGGTNLFGDLTSPAPIVSMETVLTRNPDVIVSGARDGGIKEDAWKTSWQRWPALTAVKTGHLYQVNPDIFTRPTARAADAASALCSLLSAARSPH